MTELRTYVAKGIKKGVVADVDEVSGDRLRLDVRSGQKLLASVVGTRPEHNVIVQAYAERGLNAPDTVEPEPDPGPDPVPPSTEKPIVFYDPAGGVMAGGKWTAAQDSFADGVFGDRGNTKISIINSPTTPGKQAVEYFVNQTYGSAVGPRAEHGDWSTDRLWREGTEVFIGDHLFIAEANRAGGWGFSHHTIMQLGHPGSSAAANELDIRDSGGWPHGLHLAGAMIVSGSELYNRLLPLTIRVKCSQDPNRGEVQAWLGDHEVLTTRRRRTLAGATGYFKQGQYGEAINKRIVWHGAKVGTSFASVQR